MDGLSHPERPTMTTLPLGKLDPDSLARLIAEHSGEHPRLVLGPGLGLDCAVLDYGDRYLVAKSDPITFTAENIGWYAVHVNANDIATTGARPIWFLATILLPEGRAKDRDVEAIFEQIQRACRALDVVFIGGHTEVTTGLDRPIIAATMLGEVAPERLITPRGAQPGDRILLTKGVPLEAAGILATDFGDSLAALSSELVSRARGYLHDPGISVVPEAQAAAAAGGVTAMHDPTEGGLAAGLWELAYAAGVRLEVDHEKIPIPEAAGAICEALQVDPLRALASGALLLTVAGDRLETVRRAIEDAGVQVTQIGQVRPGEGVVMRQADESIELEWPARDALAEWLERKTDR